MSPSYSELLEQAKQQLYSCSETPRIDAEVLMQEVVGESMAWLIANGDAVATKDHIVQFNGFVDRRFTGEPIAYILGCREFWTMKLKVDTRVLIPRPDTETLVERALNLLSDSSPYQILDLGTGSGAIALSLAKERPAAEVIAVDAQQAALDVAQENAKANEIDNVSFVKSDWFSEFNEEASFDLIASNPPYVEHGDPHLQQGDLRFEPETALVADDAGYGDLIRIMQGAKTHLKPNGWLLLEHGFNQAERLRKLLSAEGYVETETFKDLNQLPRCTQARWSG